jgi:hypothetical protein
MNECEDCDRMDCRERGCISPTFFTPSIAERLSTIQKNRSDKNRELMREYDVVVFRPAIKQLQKECGDIGHVKGTFHNNGWGSSWYYCKNCDARMDIVSDYD